MVIFKLLLGALTFTVAVAFAGTAGKCFSVANECSKSKDAKVAIISVVAGLMSIALALLLAIAGLIIVDAI